MSKIKTNIMFPFIFEELEDVFRKLEEKYSLLV